MIIVLSCGVHKSKETSPAIDLYRGSHFTMRRDIARKLTDDKNIYILSGKHGLIHSSTLVAPYDQIMTTDVDIERIRRQAKQLRIIDKPITFIGGKVYLSALEQVFPSVKDVLADYHGQSAVFRQKAFMKKLREAL